MEGYYKWGGQGHGLNGCSAKEGASSEEHWMLYVSDGWLHCTPETNITLYVNQLEFKSKHGKNTY